MDELFSFKNKKFTWRSAVFLLVLLGFVGALQIISEKHGIDSVLVQAASEINKHCPMLVDSVTRLDNTAALTNNKLQYSYTLLNVDRLKFDTSSFINRVKQRTINRLKTDPKAKLYRDKNVTLSIIYCDKTGAYLCGVLIPSDQY